MHLPPQSAPLYTTLSVLAETHYQHVLNLIASNSPARLEITTKTYQHFATAVKLLETILTAQVLPPKIEVETRFRLAELLFLHTENLDEADSHLQKATLLIRKTSDAQILEFEFKVKDLQCNLIQADRSGKGAKTVKNLLKQAAASALSQNLPRWYYHFVQRRAELCALEGDVPKCISIIQEGVAEARQQGHVEVQAVLTWSVARYAIITRDAAQISTAVAPLELLFESQKNTTEPAVDSQTGATAVSGPPIISNQSLQLFYNLISILYRLQSGNGKEAIKQLSALHSLVEQPTTQSMEELEAGVVHISLPTPQGTESLEVEILSRHKLHAFVFLVSGVTHKLHDNVKAKNHLLEGLKTVEREIARVSTEISDVRRMIADRDWLIELSFIMMRHLAEICMLRQEYSDAFKYLLKLKNWIESYPTLLQSHSAFLTFDWGIFFQAIGDYQRAHNWFQLAIQEGDIDVRFMAQIQLILMAFGRLYGDPTLGESLLEDLTKDSQETSLSIGQRGLVCFARGIHHTAQEAVRQTKLQLLDTIKLCDTISCTQIRFISLGLLGNLFSSGDPSQAEKMFTAAYIMAKKSHCESFAGICASVLAEIFERKGDPERVAKYSALRDEHQQKAQFAQLEVASLMEVESAKFENEKAAMTVNEHKQERSVTPATKAQPGEQPKLPGPAHVKEEKFEPEDDVPTLRTPKPRSRRKSSSSKTTKRAPRATAITVPNQKRSPDPITAVASETAQAALQHQLHQLPSDLHNSSASNPMHINSQQDLLPATVQLYDENKQHNSAKNSEMIPQGTNIYELSQEQNGVQPLSTSQSVPLHQFTSQQQFAQSMPPPYPQHLPHMPQQMPNAPYANFLQPTPPKSFHHQSPHQPKQLRDSQMPYPSPSPLDQRRQMEQFQWQQQQQQQRNVYPGQFSQQQSPATPYLSAQHSAYHPMYHNQPQMQLQHDPMLHPNYNVANPHPAHQRQQLISQDMPDIMNNPFDMNSSPMMQDLNWQPPHAEQSPGAYSKTHSSQSSQHSGSHRSYNGQNTQ